MPQILNKLSHPPSLTPNQRAVGSTPTRPTKLSNHYESLEWCVLKPFGLLLSKSSR